MGLKWKILFHKRTVKDLEQLKNIGLSGKAKALIELLEENPYQNPPPYEKLLGDLKGLCSRRINIKHRLVYEIDDKNHTVKILAMYIHYGE